MREYFSHDTDALSDIKIDKMMTDYGYIGYGYYWAIVEQLYKNGGRYYFDDLQIMAKQLGIKFEKLESFIKACIIKYTHKEKGLFEADDKGFWSNSLIKRIEKRKNSGTRKKNIEGCMTFETRPEVNIHQNIYDTACLKFGRDVVEKGLDILEKWLESPSPTAKKRLNLCHDGYFTRIDTWVIQEAKKEFQSNTSILEKLGRVDEQETVY